MISWDKMKNYWCGNKFKASVELQHFNMEKKQPTEGQEDLPQKSRFTFAEPHEPSIFFNSRFDSGNMHRVVRNSYDHYSIWTASDAQGTPNQGYPKSWFYFEVGGFHNRRVAFSIHRVHFLFAMSKRSHLYRPVYRLKSEEGQPTNWRRLQYPVISLGLNDEEELVLKFDFVFSKLFNSVEFAFIYPYSYEECRGDMEELKCKYSEDAEIFLENHELVKSYQGRSIDILIISSHQGRQGLQVFKPEKHFPFSEQKVTKFRTNKPIIFISARVHPIETPSSFCMKGIIEFLLDKRDLRAHLLRKYFVFVLVPMLNPDGVSNGHCRMDGLNQNLNRYYTAPDPQKQPSCYAVKKLCEHYSKEKRLFMYLDLHAHPAHKGNFTFGNAIFDFIEQVESQMFPKVLSQNCISFQFQQCIFSRKHMKAKDRNEDISKEGCGRVVLYKQFGLVHSYTLECGYHLNTFNNALQPQRDSHIEYTVKYKLNEKGQKIYDMTQKVKPQNEISKNHDVFCCVPQQLDDAENEHYQQDIPLYTTETFQNLGRNILISLLDIWNKNPYSRVPDLNCHRKNIAEKQSKLDRFRKEQSGIKNKQKKIVELIQEQLYGQWHKRNIFNAISAQNARQKKRNETFQVQLKAVRLTREKYSGNKEVYQLRSDYTSNNRETTPQPAAETQDYSQNVAKSETNCGSKLPLQRNTKHRGIRSRRKEGQLMGSKDAPTTQLKLNLQEQPMLLQRKIEANSLSSKIIKNGNFPAGNLRLRSIISGSNVNNSYARK